MANAQLFDLSHELRLPGMREEVQHQFENPQYDTMPFSDRAMRMAQAEVERRYRNKINRLMKNAQFKVSAEPEEIDYRGERNLDHRCFRHWQNLVDLRTRGVSCKARIFGSVGTGA